jgi:probable rRNA maturation factor
MRRMVMAALTGHCKSAVISIVIVGQAQGRQLNAQYRGKDYATNVLTFDYTPPPHIVADIVICQPVITSEARTQGKLPGHHAAHLLIHGALHACGADHENQDDAAAMEALEISILRRFRIPDPYSL